MESSLGLGPTPASQRIEALDVVRGFALIGIVLMNVDFFNRSILAVGSGMPAGLTGLDYAVSFFTQYFVTGKFWTIFSLLFGMGFAVMLQRAESAGRGFIRPYLRRIVALAVIASLHHIFIWGGDILLSYAIAAALLLLTLYGGWKAFTAALLVCGAAMVVPGAAEHLGGLASSLVFSALAAMYLRGEKLRLGLPLVSRVLMVVAALLLVTGAVLWAASTGPVPVRVGLLVGGGVLLATGWLARFRSPVESRPWRIGVATWILVFGATAIFGAATYIGERAHAAGPVPAAEKKAGDPKAAERVAERAKEIRERAQRIAADERAMEKGSYADALASRLKHYSTRLQREGGFAMLLVGLFLIGVWFVRSGVMADTGAHLPLFRRLALVGIPVGVGLGLAGSLFATSFDPATNTGAWTLASGLLMLGNLPASIGYASAAILMLHSRSALSKIRVLAPFGRMALTNYIMQSVVFSLIFYGYGLGQWGMGRAAQLGVALAVVAAQVVFSHLWLARFRYGPLEWVWRAVTYLQLPAMRRTATPVVPAQAGT